MDKLSKLLLSASNRGFNQLVKTQKITSMLNCSMMRNKVQFICAPKHLFSQQQYYFSSNQSIMKFSTTQQTNMNDLKEQEQKLIQGLEQKQNVVDQIVDLANQYLELEEIEEAINVYMEAIRINPESSRLNCKLGTLLIQLEELEQGVQYVEKGLELDHKEIGEEGLIGLASAYKMLNQNEKAINTYLKSIELNYLPSYSHQFIALLYAEQSQFDLADQHYKKSLELNPNDFLSQWAYGEIIFAKDQQQGIKIMKEAADNISTKACENKFVQEEEIVEMVSNMNFRVGQIMQHLIKDNEEAKKYYRVCLKKDPEHVEAHVQYASCLKKGDNPNLELAEYHIQKAKEIDPSKFEKKLTEWW